MKKTFPICILLSICILLGMMIPVAAANSGVSCHGIGADIALDSTGKKLDTAKSVILYELTTDTMVYTYNPDKQVNPTGLVKLLTVLVALERGNLDDTVKVHQSTLNTVAVGAVSAKLKAGEELTLRDLLYCVMVASANDACAVIAAHIGGDQAGFVALMNAKARELGCTASNFTNAHGLTDPSQVSTARDLAIIAKAALENEIFREMFGVTAYTVEATNKSDARELKTTNNMMRDNHANYDSRVIGGKPAAATTTDRSMACTAKIGSATYLCVVMNTKGEVTEDGLSIVRYGIFEEVTALLDYAQNGFEVRQILDDSQAMYQFDVAGGENAVVLRPAKDVSVVLPKNCDVEKLGFDYQLEAQAFDTSVLAGQRMGTITISYGNLIMGTCDLLAMHAVHMQGNSIIEADRLPVLKEETQIPWKTWLGYGVLVLIAVLGVAVVVSILLRLVRNMKLRKEQRRRARKRKRSR